MYEEVSVAQKTPSEQALGNENASASYQPTAAQALAQDLLVASQRAHAERVHTAKRASHTNGDGACEPNGDGDSMPERSVAIEGAHSNAVPTETPSDEASLAKASAASGKASAPPPPASLTGESADPNDLESLRRELTALRQAVSEQNASNEHTELEYREFLELYPDQSVSELPDDVRESLRQGIPLAAAFALSERRRARTAERAREVNQANQTRSFEAIRAERNGYFTPEEVRSMSPEEVRRYYGDIRASMPKWR